MVVEAAETVGRVRLSKAPVVPVEMVYGTVDRLGRCESAAVVRPVYPIPMTASKPLITVRTDFRFLGLGFLVDSYFLYYYFFDKISKESDR